MDALLNCGDQLLPKFYVKYKLVYLSIGLAINQESVGNEKGSRNDPPH
jgi:hypothetical protein